MYKQLYSLKDAGTIKLSFFYGKEYIILVLKLAYFLVVLICKMTRFTKILQIKPEAILYIVIAVQYLTHVRILH